MICTIGKDREKAGIEVKKGLHIRIMNSQHAHRDGIASIVLYGAIQFANIDYTSVIDYAVKAVIGGVVWLGFKLAADHINNKLNKKGK